MVMTMLGIHKLIVYMLVGHCLVERSVGVGGLGHVTVLLLLAGGHGVALHLPVYVYVVFVLTLLHCVGIVYLGVGGVAEDCLSGDE